MTVTCRDTSCVNGGICVDTALGFKCRCTAGFAGTNCEVEVDACQPNPCANGGTCTDRIEGFECSCPAGFAGPRCETNVDDCVGVRCQNGGTCVDLVAGHRCRCVPGYVGVECESKVDYCLAKPCANGATCRNLVNDYQCLCRSGFRGKDCSRDVDECASSPCKNGASCVNQVNNFECKCPSGYHGRFCDEEANPNGSANLNLYWRTGNMSKHVSERTDDSGLSTEHVVVIATLSTAVPVLVLVSAVVVMCMKQRRKREQQKADEEARLQNEQNTVHSSMSKRGVGGGAGDAHMIKNTWGKSVNNVLAASQTTTQTAEDRGGGTNMSNIVSVSENVANSELCYSKQAEPVPVYSLLRTRSQKQLNTDACAHRQSHRASLLLDKCRGTKLDKEEVLRADQRISILSVDSSLCNSR